jgi:Tfp pilus assembly protein FimT
VLLLLLLLLLVVVVVVVVVAAFAVTFMQGIYNCTNEPNRVPTVHSVAAVL